MNGPKDARFRIVSDGTCFGTVFLNEETGEPLNIRGVTALRIELDAKGLVQVHMSFDAIKIDMRGILSSVSSNPAHEPRAHPHETGAQ